MGIGAFGGHRHVRQHAGLIDKRQPFGALLRHEPGGVA